MTQDPALFNNRSYENTLLASGGGFDLEIVIHADNARHGFGNGFGFLLYVFALNFAREGDDAVGGVDIDIGKAGWAHVRGEFSLYLGSDLRIRDLPVGRLGRVASDREKRDRGDEKR